MRVNILLFFTLLLLTIAKVNGQNFLEFNIYNPNSDYTYYVAIAEPYENIVMGWFPIKPFETRSFPTQEGAFVYAEGPDGYVIFGDKNRKYLVRNGTFMYNDWEGLTNGQSVVFSGVLPNTTYTLPEVRVNLNKSFVSDIESKERVSDNGLLVLGGAILAGVAIWMNSGSSNSSAKTHKSNSYQRNNSYSPPVQDSAGPCYKETDWKTTQHGFGFGAKVKTITCNKNYYSKDITYIKKELKYMVYSGFSNEKFSDYSDALKFALKKTECNCN